jgi:hypothetical protein
MGWLISDEYTYVNQAIAISQGETYLSFVDSITLEHIPYKFTRYSLGNSFWIAIWIKLLSLKYIYFGSLFAILGGSWFLYRAIKSKLYFIPALGLIFLYPSFEFFSSSTMSALPSFLLSGMFIYGLFTHQESKWKWFWLCFLASFSFWVRETNIILLGGICFIHFLQDRRWFWYYFAGTVLGMIPRFLSAYYFYGDPFYYLLSESFSVTNITNNYIIYFLLLLICMPMGLFFLLRFRGKYNVPIVYSCLTFMSLYLTYSFNASAYSGFEKGVILMGRFLIPLLPFYVLAIAWYFRNIKLPKSITILGFLIVALLMTGMKYKVHQEGQIHKKVSEHIYNSYVNDHVFFDLSKKTNVIRYLNPMHGSFASQADITTLLDQEYVKKVLQLHENVYIIQTLNNVNKSKSEITQMITEVVDEVSKLYSITEVEHIKIKPGLHLQVLKIE